MRASKVTSSFKAAPVHQLKNATKLTVSAFGVSFAPVSADAVQSAAFVGMKAATVKDLASCPVRAKNYQQDVPAVAAAAVLT